MIKATLNLASALCMLSGGIVSAEINDFSTGPFSYCVATTTKTICNGCINPIQNFGQCDQSLPPITDVLKFGGKRRNQKVLQTVVTSFAASCGLDVDNEIQCWGCNLPRQNFQCDIPDDIKYEKFKPSENQLSSLKTLDLSEVHTCAILDNDEVRCWGCEEPENYGQCETPDDIKARAVAIGLHTSCALNNKGQVRCWGENVNEPKRQFKNVRSFAGASKVFGILSDELILWGENAPNICSADNIDCTDASNLHSLRISRDNVLFKIKFK